jgi:hypothetical protein
MYTIYLDWINLKNDIISKGFPLNYKTTLKGYEVFVLDRGLLWFSNLTVLAEILDFETNYKEEANKCLYSEDGKIISRTESRPLGTTTCFTGRGDSDTGIGDGTELRWDFSNDDNDIDNLPSGSPYKRKRLEFKFLDPIYIKEGAIYFHKAKTGSYINVYIVCPQGHYYLDNNGVPTLATEDTPIAQYVNYHWLEGDCPMGDELNTESCSVEIPNNYKFWIDITVPNSDSESTGHLSLELYRKRTRIL